MAGTGRLHIHHLAADHALAAGRPGQSGHKLATHLGRGMGLGCGKNFKGQRQQGIARQHGRCLVELDMGRGLAPAQHIVVHARQIVMHQRIGMYRFKGSTHPQGWAWRYAEEFR